MASGNDPTFWDLLLQLPVWVSLLAIFLVFTLAVLGLLLKYPQLVHEWLPTVKRSVLWVFSPRQRLENRYLKRKGGCNHQLRRAPEFIAKKLPAASFLQPCFAMELEVDRRVPIARLARVDELKGVFRYKIHSLDCEVFFAALLEYVASLKPCVETSDIFLGNKAMEESLKLMVLCALVNSSGGKRFLKRPLQAHKSQVLSNKAVRTAYDGWGEVNRSMRNKGIYIATLSKRDKKLVMRILAVALADA